MSYLADVGTLARKDLLLELRARDTLPAMLLFVVSTFVVFHFALPAGSSKLAASGLLWVAIVFTALLGLGRAFVPEREQHVAGAVADCDPRRRDAVAGGQRAAKLGVRRVGVAVQAAEDTADRLDDLRQRRVRRLVAGQQRDVLGQRVGRGRRVDGDARDAL